MGTRILNFFDGFTSNTTPSTLDVTGSVASPTAITAAGGITPSGYSNELAYVESDGGAVNITANPQIAAGTSSGETLTIYGTSDTDYIILEHGNGLVMNGSMAVKKDETIKFIWNATSWAETSRNN